MDMLKPSLPCLSISVLLHVYYQYLIAHFLTYRPTFSLTYSVWMLFDIDNSIRCIRNIVDIDITLSY
jgi:hypothetical protein